jgi:hypothetical protein
VRAAIEGISLVSAAAGLWWRRLSQLVFVFAMAFGLHLLGLNLSVRLGPDHQIAATVVFVLAVLAQVGALVIMLWLCRPAGDEETALDVAALAIGPFLAVYALWGLVDDEVYALFAANIAVSGLGGTDEWSVNLQWLGFYVILAAVTWVLRQLVGLAGRQRPTRPLLLLGVILEGTWTFASALALLSGLGRVVDWVTSRTVWQGLSSAWYAVLGVLPDLRLPFDLTLPEALHAVLEWLTRTVVPGVWTAVLLPLMWLALTAVVFGRREIDARTVAAGTPAEVAHDRLVPRWRTGRWRSLVHRVALLVTGDLRTKYLPVLHAFRLLWATGPAFLAAYLVVATAVETARSWATLSLARLLGPRDPSVALASSWADELTIGCVFTTFAIALYAAAGHRVLGSGVTEGAAPAGSDPAPRTGAPVR